MNEKEKSAELLEYFNGLSLKEVLGLARKSFILLDENTKFEAALVEIREITIKNCDYRKNNDNCINSGCSKNYKNCTGYKILTKINEVLKDER